MAISYPLATPTTIGIESIELRAVNAVAISQSPFTYQQQVISHGGQKWEASVSIPPVRRDLAAPWKAMLTALKGQTGTFLLGDPDYATPQGTALSFKKNLLTFTEKFDNAAWTKSGDITVTPNSIASPDGFTSADTIEKNSGTFAHVRQAAVTVIGQAYTASVYVKQGTAAETLIAVLNSTVSTTLAQVTVNWSDPEASGAVDVGSGWYRVSIPFTAIDLGSTLLIYPSGASASLGSVYAWGTQIESGSLTDYQPIADAYGPFVNGGSQTGDELQITGASPNEESYFKAGDYIQLGSGSGSRLHTILTDVVTDDLGQATLDIWPSLRSSPSDGSTVIVENCKGVFRLSGNMNSWSINNASSYGISFECVEVIV